MCFDRQRYGYALDANQDLQTLLGADTPLLVLKGHLHRPAIWTVRKLTLIDAGSLLDHSDSGAVIVDFDARTATTLTADQCGVSASSTVALSP